MLIDDENVTFTRKVASCRTCLPNKKAQCSINNVTNVTCSLLNGKSKNVINNYEKRTFQYEYNGIM